MLIYLHGRYLVRIKECSVIHLANVTKMKLIKCLSTVVKWLIQRNTEVILEGKLEL